MAPILNMEESELVSRIQSSVKSLLNLAIQNKQRVSLYLHNTIPFGTIIAIDEDLTEGSLIVETKPYKLHSASSFSYKLLNAENSILYKNIIEGCKKSKKIQQKLQKTYIIMEQIEYIRTLESDNQSVLLIFRVLHECKLSDFKLVFENDTNVRLPEVNVAKGDFIWVTNMDREEVHQVVSKNSSNTKTWILHIANTSLDLKNLRMWRKYNVKKSLLFL